MIFSKNLILLFLAFLLLGINEAHSQAFPRTEGTSQNPRAEGRDKKKYTSFRKSRKKSTAYQRKKEAVRAGQSRVASDFRTNEPHVSPDKNRQQQQASQFKGEQPFIAKNKEIVQQRMSRFKGNAIPIQSQSQKDLNQLRISRYRGTMPVQSASQKELNQLQMSRYRGNYPVALANRKQAYEMAAMKQSRFVGPVQVLSPQARKSMSELASARQSRFVGPVKVLSPAAQRANYEMKSMQMSRFKGERIRIQKIKNAYPTIVYLKAKKKTSFEQKERFRKRMLKKINRNKKKQIPPSERKIDKDNIPQYDSHENEIWSKPRNIDGSIREVKYKKKFSLNPFKKKDKSTKSKVKSEEKEPVKEETPKEDNKEKN
jgi:hypothetical protein